MIKVLLCRNVAFAEYFYEFYEKTGALRMTLFYDNRMLAERAFYCLRMCYAPELLYGKWKIQRRNEEKYDSRIDFSRNRDFAKCPRIVTRTNIFIILQLFSVYCNFI